jgi:hypothetical protein
MNCFSLLRNSVWTAFILTTVVTLGIANGTATAQTPQPLFSIATQLPLSGTAFPVFTGDFNGDGVPDLAYVTETNNLEIVLGVGTSTPSTVTTPSICPSTAGQAQVNFADVNNDKKLDLIFSCNGYITIQLGNGDGTFQTAAFFAVNAQMPVLVDLNGDGFLDIAALVPSSTTPKVAVLLNQGAASPGTFQSPKLYAVPSGATGLLSGDLNGDGKQDVVTTINTGTDYPTYTAISILYGNGDGTLKAPATQSTSSFSSFTIGDFNGDGVTDLALLLLPPTNTSLFTSVQIFLGSTSGTFSPGALLGVAAQAVPTSGNSQPMAAIALTSSGNLDLVVTTNVLSVFLGDGKGGFTPSGSYGVAGSPLLFADLTGQGNLGLILGNVSGTFYFAGDGDGSFQAVPGTPVYGVFADVNNDGLTDILFAPPQGGSYFGTALGRGDGAFSALDQLTPLPTTATEYFLMAGDFNGDGKIDALAIQPGSTSQDPCGDSPNAQLLPYLGSGDGRFQPAGTAVPLGVNDAAPGVTGDFNSDGNLDVILPYGSCQPGLVFVPGKGDGTFGTPVVINATQDNQYPGLLVGDLNNDKKLDLVWGDAVLLGNGDGTFKQIPLTIPASPAGPIAAVAIADLNGDGILDAVSSPGTAIYAGNGDGTFQTMPFYTVPLPQGIYASSFATADVNGDGNPDLLLVQTSSAPPYLGVYLGDGHGNFTQDTNTYYVSTSQSNFGANTTVPSRLNSQAPPLASDNKLDLLIALASNNPNSSTYTVSLLNQTNPVPPKPAPIASTTSLQASPTTGALGAAITLTAFVFGTDPTGSVTFAVNGNTVGTAAIANGTATFPISLGNPGSYAVTATYPGDNNNTASASSPVSVTIGQATTTTALQASPSAADVNGKVTLTATVTGYVPGGTVSFASGTSTLGKATLAGGVATLQISFAAAGTYPITATYQGDANNLASTSSPVTVVIAAPDFTVAASPTSGSVAAGQTATFTFTVTPAAGYAGTVKLSCGALPSMAACSFSPASITPSGGAPVSSTLTITTAAATAMLHPDRPFGPPKPWIPAGGLALAGILGLAFAPIRMRRWNDQLRLLSWGLLLASISLSMVGCGGSGGSGSNTPSNPGTPAGSYTISVNAADSAGGPQHAVSIALTVQ